MHCFEPAFPYVKTLGMRRVTSYPVDLALGKENLYVLCRGEWEADIRRLSWEDDDLGVISGLGKEDGKLLWPVSVIMDADENLYVSDEALNRISVFSEEGQFLSKWGEEGSEAGQLNRPAGMVFDAEENIYIADSLNHRIQKFTKDGKHLLSWGSFGDGERQLNMPWGITLDEMNDVYVADWRNDRVQKFSPTGDFMLSIGGAGDERGEFNRPSGVAVDADGDIYVADRGNNRVQMFNEKGQYLEKFIGDASLSKSATRYLMTNAKPLRLREMASLEPQKRFRSPTSVHVDSEGRLLVTDFGSYRIQMYQKEALPLTPEQIIPELRSPTLQVT